MMSSAIETSKKEKEALTQNIWEIWDTMKGSSLRIINIEKGEEIQVKGTEKYYQHNH